MVITVIFWREQWNLKVMRTKGVEQIINKLAWVVPSNWLSFPEVHKSCCDLGFDISVAERFRKNRIVLEVRDVL